MTGYKTESSERQSADTVQAALGSAIMWFVFIETIRKLLLINNVPCLPG